MHDLVVIKIFGIANSEDGEIEIASYLDRLAVGCREDVSGPHSLAIDHVFARGHDPVALDSGRLHQADGKSRPERSRAASPEYRAKQSQHLTMSFADSQNVAFSNINILHRVLHQSLNVLSSIVIWIS